MRTLRAHTAFVLLTALGSAGAWGCASSTSQQPGDNGEAGTAKASLHRAKSCPDLLSDLKADAHFKVEDGVRSQIGAIQACIAQYGDNQCAMFGGGVYASAEAGGGGVAKGAPTAAPAAADSSAGSNAAPSAASYSQTNTQVKGVDEADIVKNDGRNIYVLHGRAFKVVHAWPAAELKEAASIDIEGDPTEMFVQDGKVVVYSNVNGVEIYKAAGVTPKDTYQDYAYASGGVATDVAAMPPAYGGYTSGPYVPLSKMTVLTLNGDTPAVAREIYFEGSYLDARRIATQVRTVFQGYAHGPKLKYGIYEYYTPDPKTGATPTYPTKGSEVIKVLQRLQADDAAIIDASQLSDWLPYTFVREGTAVRAQTVACEDFYVPNTGSTQSGFTEVASLDLADPTALPKETAIIGQADTVYASEDTLYLASRGWIEMPIAWGTMGGAPVASSSSAGSGSAGTGTAAPAPATPPAPAGASTQSLRIQAAAPVGVTAWPSEKTHVHKFEFKSDPRFPGYVGSGTVIGGTKNQFSLDDKDGYLRIATTEHRSYLDSKGQYVSPSPTVAGGAPPQYPSSLNHLFVLGAKGDSLEIVGDAGDLAPNEQIQSVRFVGARGYLVTFRQVDPLFVFDLSAPQSPKMLAELTIPGFSEYMHPIDDNHLLTIGRDGDAQRTRGLALQIFDVTDGAHPTLTQKFAYSASEYGNSEAEYDHKAFTYFADRQLLAFPYYAYNASTSSGMRSSLELFKVDLAAGFTKLGSIDHTPLESTYPSGYCGGWYGPSVRRGVFMENFVYSISYGGIIAKDTANLTAPGSQLALPLPHPNPEYGPVCGY